MPRGLAAARVLLFVLFGFTVIGVLGALAAIESLTGEILGLLVYAAVPGVAGLLLALRAWTGGRYARWSLIGVQGLLILQALGSLGRGDPRGLPQLVIPVVVTVLLSRRPAREWFLLPEYEREGNPGFSLARMLRWRPRDEGQTTTEYAGLVAVVAAIIIALLVTGWGGQIFDGVKSAVCSVTGASCPPPDQGGDTSVEAGDGGDGHKTDPGTAQGGGSASGAGGSSSGSASAGSDGSGGSDSGGGDGDDKSTLDQLGDMFTSPFKAAWGDVKDTAHMVRHPIDSTKEMWHGLSTYTGDWWSKRSDELGKQWDKGGWHYIGVPLQWAGSPAGFLSDFAVDSFVDVDSFKKGDWGTGIGTTAWNIGSMFIPGVGEVKWLERLNKINKLSKVAKVAERAAEAAERARKAAKIGDAAAARKAAKDADKAADDAEAEARKSGCTIAMGAGPVRPWAPSPGTDRPVSAWSGGTVLTSYTVPASSHSTALHPTALHPTALHPTALHPTALRARADECDEGKKEEAEATRKEADDAEKVADGVDLQQAADEAKKTIRDAKDRQNTPKGERFQLDENKIDDLVAKAKDNPDRSKGEIGKEELAQSLKELTDMLKTKNIDNQSRGALGGPVLRAGNRHALAEAMAEVRVAKRAADEAADGTKVYAGIGAKKGRKTVDMGDGTSADVSAIDDADVVYKGKDGDLHVVEVKNTGQAATQASVIDQAKKLADWQKAHPGRKARYEIETQDGWDKVFDGYQKDKKTGRIPDGTPAETFAANGLDLRVAGQDLTPRQLKEMNDAWKKKTDAEKQAARDSGKMKDPKTAMEYLGVS